MKSIVRGAIALFVSLCIASAGYAGSALDEVNAKFTYRGKPIHPFLIEKISTRITESAPVVVTIDIAAGSDFEPSKIEERNGGWWTEDGESSIDYHGFWYKWLGKLANGWHVVEAGANGGGTGFVMDLMFLRVSEGEIIYFDNQHAKQILLTVVQTKALGDHYEGDIKVFPNKVVIPASTNQGGGGAIDKDVELKFPLK